VQLIAIPALMIFYNLPLGDENVSHWPMPLDTSWRRSPRQCARLPRTE
jgi:hypothetical protein